MPVVRKEEPGDADAVRTLTEAAFAASELGDNGEADLIDRIRASGDPQLSLVAVEGGEVVGHVLFSAASIVTDNGEKWGMALGPMSVKPGWQRKGVGGSLIRGGFRKLGDYLFVVVFGHPEYYPRFGFKPAADLGIRHAFAGMPQELLFLRTRTECCLDPLRNGVAFFHPEFGAQTG